jgi:hypothetical protein
MTRKQPIPAKSKLLKNADTLWSRAVRDDWGNRCAVCGNDSHLHAHHLVPRHHEATRYQLRNGICLCSYCHIRNKHFSPHMCAAGWLDWLSTNWPKLHQWYTGTVERGEHRLFDGTKNVAYYCGIIQGLREYVEENDFEQIVGIRFSAWLSSEEKENKDG